MISEKLHAFRHAAALNISLIVALALAAAASAVHAQTYVWSSTSSESWDASTDWSPNPTSGGPTGSGTTVFMGSGASVFTSTFANGDNISLGTLDSGGRTWTIETPSGSTDTLTIGTIDQGINTTTPGGGNGGSITIRNFSSAASLTLDVTNIEVGGFSGSSNTSTVILGGPSTNYELENLTVSGSGTPGVTMDGSSSSAAALELDVFNSYSLGLIDASSGSVGNTITLSDNSDPNENSSYWSTHSRTVSVTGLTGSGALTLNAAGGTEGGNVVLDLSGGNAADYSSAAVLANYTGTAPATASLSLQANLTGGETQTLTGASTFSGGTTINSGTLYVSNASNAVGSGLGTGAVTVDSGGTLGGTGVIAPVSNNVTINGTLSPGDLVNPDGTLAFTLSSGNQLVFDSGSQLNLTLGTNSSSVALTGTPANFVSGLSNLTLNLTEGADFEPGQAYILISDATTAASGTPETVDAVDLNGSLLGTSDYTISVDASNDYTFEESITPPLPTIPSGTYNVTAYGAVGNGTTDNTTDIQDAINAAKTAGGGTVVIPAASGAYLSQPLTLYSNINLQVDSGATLQAQPYGTYSSGGTVGFITIYSGSSNVEISGGGTIDGNGLGWWGTSSGGTNPTGTVPAPRPRLVQTDLANIVYFTDVTFQNSPEEHLTFDATSNVTIDGITVSAPANSPNTDAIDPAGKHYLIENCTISVGDDDIAVKPQDTPCGVIAVTGCTINSGQGISIGAATDDGLDGMIVSNCTFNGTTYGLRMKTDPVTGGGVVKNVAYSNITMTNVRFPILFYSYYNVVGDAGATSGANETTTTKVQDDNATPPNPISSSSPTWENITISNLTSVNSAGGTGYATIWGLPLSPYYAANVTLNNVSLSGSDYYGFEFYDAQGVQLTGTTTTADLAGTVGPGIVTYNAQVITAQPQSATVDVGGTATFNISVAATSGTDGTITPTYQWDLNGVALANGTQSDGSGISGATTASLTICNVQADETGDLIAANVTHALDTYNNGTDELDYGVNGYPATATSSAATLTVP